MGGTTKKMSTTPDEIMPLRGSIIDAFMSGNVGQGRGSGAGGTGANLGNNPYNQSWMNASRASDPKYQNALKMSQKGGFWGGVGNSILKNKYGGPSNQGASSSFLDMLNSNMFQSGPSLDSFADPNGALFSTVKDSYSDMFNQNRAEALAQAKESSGNLTGTGYANNLGSAVNRSLGEQNATLGSLLNQLAMAQYGQENANVQNNAQRFMQMLMQMSGGGVGPSEIVQSGGIGSILGPIAGFAGSYYGARPPAAAKG